MKPRVRQVGFALATLLAILPGVAAAWRALNLLEVVQISDTVWEVIGEPGSWAVDYWCGAGDYATSVLRSSSVTRIYVWRGVGPSVARPGRTSVQFAFAPPEGADTSTGLTLDIKRAGDNLTTAFARQYCFGNDPFEERWRPGG